MTLTYKKAKEIATVSYLGAVASSSKIAKSSKYKEDTYVIYLAPANQSGHEVCPMRSEQCTKLCLNASGRNKFDVIDGDKYDMRYLDPQGVVVGLRFKKIRDYKGVPKSAFIIPNDDPNLTW